VQEFFFEDEKLHQRVTVHNMSTIYHIFKAYWCNFLSALT